jgi:hypothetical protein
VVLLTDGPRGLLTPGSRLGCWRASWVWYALALGVPLFAHFAAASITSRWAHQPSLGRHSSTSSAIAKLAPAARPSAGQAHTMALSATDSSLSGVPTTTARALVSRSQAHKTEGLEHDDESPPNRGLNSGASGTRTPDLFHAMVAGDAQATGCEP